ncbi:unnamed protein product [Tuber aestivum]|uniref:Xylulose 5-phosphate/Fructose 6-phosphate phosphoketolase N-terminal domain-containing protein n=1 Tax=Tuber aestivum TaxID=59557 RepID=A0A292Q100_9PEZI|nr:unnamed protein product [Tuber aestivum]
MPGEVADRPNPTPTASDLPESVLDLAVKLDTKDVLPAVELNSLECFRRAANYIAAAMIFLRDNVLLERELKSEDIKPRLLGHWGTCPGLVLVYSHLNRLIEKWGSKMMFVVGPGHGAPAILATLWLEGSLEHFYPEYSVDHRGLHNLIANFSTPTGFPSHINAQVPGCIHEGGELGYALAVAFGAIMDKKDLVVPVVIGDGEAESGPTAAYSWVLYSKKYDIRAWHGYKYIDPVESGAVLPIVHVNGFKISERTIYGCMDDREITSLFTGYGYKVRIVSDLENIDNDLAASMDWAMETIRHIQKAARSGKPIEKPRWPVIILRTPKGWGGPKELHGKFIEGSFHSHQVPLPGAKSDSEELGELQYWLKRYDPISLFDKNGKPVETVMKAIPTCPLKRMGVIKDSFEGYQPPDVPDWLEMGVQKHGQASSMKAIGDFLKEVLKRNENSVRIFSPDELESNKLDAVLEYTGRNFQWGEHTRANDGRVIEILSEHTCQGFMQGYTLTGRTGIFPSYESFLGIINTMMVQYSKFRKMGRETHWRKDTASLNYIETSTWARQEHNGHSHQNPSFIGAVLNLKADAARVYLPPDANCFLSTIAHCLRSKNYVNLMVGSKQPTPVWLSPEEAQAHCRAGASIWEFASTDKGLNPDAVLVGIGTEVTFEVIAAASLLRTLVPELRVRVVNVTDLLILSPEDTHPHALDDEAFNSLFTRDSCVHINYHGYKGEISGLLFGRKGMERVTVAGYNEEGSTTTPFDMMLRNGVSRYHVAIQAVRGGAKVNGVVAVRMVTVIGELQHRIRKTEEHIRKWHVDPDDAYNVPRFE